jgi:hypothetical protein
MSNETLGGGSLMGTWLVFQVGYYKTPMPSTPPRVESAPTLGRKCWAFGYIKHLWEPTPLRWAVTPSHDAAPGLDLSSFISEYDRALPLSPHPHALREGHPQLLPYSIRRAEASVSGVDRGIPLRFGFAQGLMSPFLEL